HYAHAALGRGDWLGPVVAQSFGFGGDQHRHTAVALLSRSRDRCFSGRWCGRLSGECTAAGRHHSRRETIGIDGGHRLRSATTHGARRRHYVDTTSELRVQFKRRSEVRKRKGYLRDRMATPGPRLWDRAWCRWPKVP